MLSLCIIQMVLNRDLCACVSASVVVLCRVVAAVVDVLNAFRVLCSVFGWLSVVLSLPSLTADADTARRSESNRWRCAGVF